MSTSETITDALADLQAAVIAGQPIDVAIREIAEEYEIKPDVLRARADREGGLIQNAEKLRHQSHLISLLQAYEDEGHLFGYPKLTFSSWYESKFGASLTATDIALIDKELAGRVARGQQQWFQRQMMGIYRDRPDAQD